MNFFNMLDASLRLAGFNACRVFQSQWDLFAARSSWPVDIFGRDACGQLCSTPRNVKAGETIGISFEMHV